MTVMGVSQSNTKGFTLAIKDTSLQRLYRALFSYCTRYSDYSFDIIRYPRFYLLTFHAWGDS